MNKKVVKSEQIFYKDGKIEIDIKDNAILTDTEMDNLKKMAIAKYPAIFEHRKIIIAQTIKDEEEFFDEHSSVGFFGSIPKLTINGMKYTKEEYMEEVKNREDMSLDKIKIEMETEFTDVNLSKDKLTKKDKTKFEKMFDNAKSGKMKNINEVQPHHFIIEIPQKERNFENNKEYGLLGKPKKSRT